MVLTKTVAQSQSQYLVSFEVELSIPGELYFGSLKIMIQYYFGK
jgi:hypothetical protein